MAAEAEAAREARAKIIKADGEQKATKYLREAAKVLDGSQAALQLRYLQTLSTIGNEKNTTIIFPVPIDIISGFMNISSGVRKEAATWKKENDHPKKTGATVNERVVGDKFETIPVGQE
ncbi:band 7 protein AGAP004871-like isoform X2 [Tigriopus californicus]|nr:band 7 protein AGAP004871-like isoform X2 [Tigriopus californicus]